MELSVNVVEQRRRLAGALGMQFGGDRDIYAAAGYDLEIPFDRYRSRYERQDIAARIVNAPAQETWRRPPVLLDGTDEKTAGDHGEFIRAWQQLTSIEDVGDELEDRKTIWHYLRRADELAGIGRYGVMLVGINDGEPLDIPLKRNSVSGPEGFLYLSVFDEGDAAIDKLENDSTSPRYGLPAMYRLSLGTNLLGESMTPTPVHWSRVIHVADGLKGDEVYGVPRLRPAWNRLLDIEKIMAGAGEAAWKLMYKGLILSTKDGYRLADDEVTQTKIDEYVHGLSRFLQLEGMDVTVAGGEIVDPTGLVMLNVALIAATTNIPQRILIGSERGELASSQDAVAWDRHIAERQRNFAEPLLLRPLVNRLVYAGVLPKPASGAYVVRWPELSEPDAQGDATVAKTYAEALEKAAAGGDTTVDLAAFVQTFVRGLDAQTSVVEKAMPSGGIPLGATVAGREGVTAANAAPFRGDAWRNYP